jgi:hypothetical protein
MPIGNSHIKPQPKQTIFQTSNCYQNGPKTPRDQIFIDFGPMFNGFSSDLFGFLCPKWLNLDLVAQLVSPPFISIISKWLKLTTTWNPQPTTHPFWNHPFGLLSDHPLDQRGQKNTHTHTHTHTHNPQPYNSRNMVAKSTKHFPKALARRNARKRLNKNDNPCQGELSFLFVLK